MPVNVLQSDAEKYKGLSLTKAEKDWEKAKVLAKKQGKNKNYPYIMSIYQNLTSKYKTESEMTLREAAQETGGDVAYQDFIDKKLKDEYGVNSIDDLSDEDKKDFFNSVESEWESDKEKKEEAILELRHYILENADILEGYVNFELEDEDPVEKEEISDKINSAMANPGDYKFRGKKGSPNITIVPQNSIYTKKLPFQSNI